MPQLPQIHNPKDYNDMRDFTPVPPGEYISKAIASELKDTSTGGSMLVYDFVIAAGPYQGKTFVTRLNLVNSNPTAVKIANEELATFARAAGAAGPVQQSEQLHNIAVVVKLGLEMGTAQYGPKNTVLGYSSVQGLTEAPTNPEPDENTKAIISGLITSDTPTTKTNATPVVDTKKVPDAPAGFAAPAEQQHAAEASAPPPWKGSNAEQAAAKDGPKW